MSNLLHVGDTVAVVSPSISLNRRRDFNIDGVVRYLTSLGFNVLVAPSCYSGSVLTTDSDKAKADDIMAMYRNPEVKALFALHGGAGSLRVLPFLDFEEIKRNPKPLIGFSDTSSIQMGIYAKTGLPYVSGFLGEYELRQGEVDAQVAQELQAVIDGRTFRSQDGQSLRGGVAEGVLIGGNLSIFSDLNGTSYYPDIRDKIILLEDECEKPYKINLMLTQLRFNPLFNTVKGVVFGRFSECELEESTFGTVDEVIDDFVRQTRIPVIKEFNYGHFSSRHVLTLGVPYRLDANNCVLEQIG